MPTVLTYLLFDSVTTGWLLSKYCCKTVFCPENSKTASTATEETFHTSVILEILQTEDQDFIFLCWRCLKTTRRSSWEL